MNDCHVEVTTRRSSLSKFGAYNARKSLFQIGCVVGHDRPRPSGLAPLHRAHGEQAKRLFVYLTRVSVETQNIVEAMRKAAR